MKGLMAEVEPLLVAALAEEFGAVVWAVVDEVVAAIQVRSQMSPKFNASGSELNTYSFG